MESITNRQCLVHNANSWALLTQDPLLLLHRARFRFWASSRNRAYPNTKLSSIFRISFAYKGLIRDCCLKEYFVIPDTRKCDTLYCKQWLMFFIKWTVWSLQYLGTRSWKKCKKNKRYLFKMPNISVFRVAKYLLFCRIFIYFRSFWEWFNENFLRRASVLLNCWFKL